MIGIPCLIDRGYNIAFYMNSAFQLAKRRNFFFLDGDELGNWYIPFSNNDSSASSSHTIHHFKTFGLELTCLHVLCHQPLLLLYGHNNMVTNNLSRIFYSFFLPNYLILSI